MQTRMRSLHDFVGMAGFFFQEDVVPPAAADLIQRKMDAAATLVALQAARARLAILDEVNCVQLEVDMRALAQELGLKVGQLFGTLRVAVTGQRVSPPLFETMEILGLDECLRRIDQALVTLQRKS